MKNRISSEYVPRIKVLIFADFLYYSIVIVKNTQTQYFGNLISKLCASVLNNDNTVMHQVTHVIPCFFLHSLGLSWFLSEQ